MEKIYYPVAHRTQMEFEAFKTKFDTFDTSVIADIFKQVLNLDVLEWHTPSSWSDAHLVYFVSTKQYTMPFVFRANLGIGDPETTFLVEYLVTKQAAAIGIPTNTILHVDISRNQFPFDFQIQEKLIGENLEDPFDGSQATYDHFSFGNIYCKTPANYISKIWIIR